MTMSEKIKGTELACNYKSIRIKKTTRDLIDTCGFRGESFDDIIQRVFQEYSSTHDRG
jgi:hypothetical protein